MHNKLYNLQYGSDFELCVSLLRLFINFIQTIYEKKLNIITVRYSPMQGPICDMQQLE